MKYTLFSLFCLYITLPSCTDPKPANLSSFYISIDSLATPKAYEFHRTNGSDTAFSHFWHISKKTDGQEQLIDWERIDGNYIPDMAITEQVVSNGIITKSYDFISYDSTQQDYIKYPNQIKQAVVFPFDIPTDSNLVFRFECNFKIPPEFLQVKMVRDRKFSHFSTESLFGKTVRTAYFKTEEFYDIEDKEKGGFWNQKKQKTEVYAEGYGLIRTIENTEGTSSITFLHKIYNLPDVSDN